MPSIRDEFGRILDLRWSLARDQCASQPICELRVGPNRGKTPKSCPFKNEGIPEGWTLCCSMSIAARLTRRVSRLRSEPVSLKGIRSSHRTPEPSGSASRDTLTDLSNAVDRRSAVMWDASEAAKGGADSLRRREPAPFRLLATLRGLREGGPNRWVRGRNSSAGRCNIKSASSSRGSGAEPAHGLKSLIDDITHRDHSRKNSRPFRAAYSRRKECFATFVQLSYMLRPNSCLGR